MRPIPTEQAVNRHLRFIFDDKVVSFRLNVGATFAEIAEAWGELSDRNYGKPMSIDVTFAKDAPT